MSCIDVVVAEPVCRHHRSMFLGQQGVEGRADDTVFVEVDATPLRRCRCGCLCGEYGSSSAGWSDDAREMTPRLSSLMPTSLRRCRCGCLCGEYGSSSAGWSDDAREMTPRLSSLMPTSLRRCRCGCLCGEYGSSSAGWSDDAREMTPRLSSLMPTSLRRCRCGCLCGEYGCARSCTLRVDTCAKGMSARMSRKVLRRYARETPAVSKSWARSCRTFWTTVHPTPLIPPRDGRDSNSSHIGIRRERAQHSQNLPDGIRRNLKKIGVCASFQDCVPTSKHMA